MPPRAPRPPRRRASAKAGAPPEAPPSAPPPDSPPPRRRRRRRSRRLTPGAWGRLLGMFVVTAVPLFLRDTSPPEPHLAVAPDAGTEGPPEPPSGGPVLTVPRVTPVEALPLEEAPSALGAGLPRGLLPGQQPRPCVPPGVELGEHPGCWLRLEALPPCPPQEGVSEHRGRCYVPALVSGRRLPVSGDGGG